MAYMLGFMGVVVLAVVCVVTLGPIGALVFVAVLGMVGSTVRWVRRRHYDPLAVYEAETRATRHR